MKIRDAKLILTLLLMTLALGGCSFGGFDDKSTISAGGDGSSSTDTKLTGVASKGLFTSGTVEVYSVDGQGNKTLLRRSTIGAFGNYSVRIPTTKAVSGSSYTGVVMVQAYGSYLDEATGQTLSIGSDAPLRAALANPSGTPTVAVTPLTELAVRQALQASGGTLTATAVNSANSQISELFRVDIIATDPVRADRSDAGFGNQGTTQEQKDYSLALAAISWLAKGSGSVAATLQDLNGSIASGSMATEAAVSLGTALKEFLASEVNLTGVTDSTLTNLGTLGGSTKKLKISLAGKLDPATAVGGVSFMLHLPVGVTLKGDFKNPDVVELLDGVLAASGANTSTQVQARYFPADSGNSATVYIVAGTTGSLPLAEILTLLCDIPPGAAPLPGDFWVSEFVAKDGNGAPLSGVGIAVPFTLE
ncbi:hypothetical protein [Geomesophilobacter sediminis]|uniref:Uncharacterized protein n=1 Tax=Geomesophilobacter sediminis TaxID=2798584 RepID=A0A8J7M3F5_9BACT|nr:hypothetical protein [Geomesophilobacter sediminis]MBJ6727967.1 hypothetical protein [Geomesophilobacter sediminis]